NKEKTPKEADTALKANILDFCEEHYKDILPVIMDKILHDKRKEVHARLDFKENPRKSRRVKENSQNSSARTLSNTYSSTKTGPNEGNSRDRSHGKGRSRKRSSSSRDCPRNRNRPRGIKESYSNNRSSYRTGDRHGYHARNRNCSCSMKRGKGSKSLLSRMSESSISDGGRWKTKAKKRKPTDEEDLSVPWTCEDQKKYVKDPVEIHNIKQRDGETIEEFIERFKIETERMKGAPECMQISGFMHGVNNPELTKRLNECVPKTMEEMMTATTAFIRGETVVSSKKKVHTPWKS
nr:reverse transcriptase domain-containing protein [Tanacetum cinerariifolium]